METASHRAGRASLFGKLPWALDYVRIRHGHPAAVALDSWLVAALQALARAGAKWPTAHVRFLFQPRTLDAVLVGVLAPSRDRAGREFPLAIFSVLDGNVRGRELAAVPQLAHGFLEAAADLLERVPAQSEQDTRRALDALATPSLAALAESVDAHERYLRATSARQLASQLYPSHDPRQLAAALARLHAWRAGAASPQGRGPVLDCPIRSHAHVGLWLALADVGDSGQAPAGAQSAFWMAGGLGAGRMLLACGAPPATVPLWLGGAGARSERLLSLTPSPSSAPRAADLAPSAALREEDFHLSIETFALRLAGHALRAGEAG